MQELLCDRFVMLCLFASTVYLAFITAGLYGNVSQVTMLAFMPFVYTTGFGLVFTTLDCEIAEAGCAASSGMSHRHDAGCTNCFWRAGEHGWLWPMFFSFALNSILYPGS